LSYSGNNRRIRAGHEIVCSLLFWALLTGCSAAGYHYPPDVPDQEISLSATAVPDPLVRRAIREHIDGGARFTNEIQRLDLSARRISSTDHIVTIQGIEQFRNLTYLDLQGQRLPDREVAFIAGLTSMEELYLDGNRIANLDRLSRLDRLRLLSARNNRIETLSSLSSLQNIEILDLSFNERLQDDPRRMAEVRSLRRFILQGTPRLDRRALEDLARERPDMEIIWR
jgi:hypothetical protein